MGSQGAQSTGMGRKKGADNTPRYRPLEVHLSLMRSAVTRLLLAGLLVF